MLDSFEHQKKKSAKAVLHHANATMEPSYSSATTINHPAFVLQPKSDHAAPRLVAPGHLGLTHTAPTTPQCSKDFQQEQEQEGRAGSSWAQLFLDPDPQPWRCPSLVSPLLLANCKVRRWRGQAGQRVLLGLQHNLSIALTFEALQTQEPFLHAFYWLLLNVTSMWPQCLRKEKAADGNHTPNISGTERTKRIYPDIWYCTFRRPFLSPHVNLTTVSLHYWLRLIESGQLRFWNFVFLFMGKCHFHFLIN